MNQRISILYELSINAVYIIPPEWNDMTLGIETEIDYIFIYGLRRHNSDGENSCKTAALLLG